MLYWTAASQARPTITRWSMCDVRPRVLGTFTGRSASPDASMKRMDIECSDRSRSEWMAETFSSAA